MTVELGWNSYYKYNKTVCVIIEYTLNTNIMKKASYDLCSHVACKCFWSF